MSPALTRHWVQSVLDGWSLPTVDADAVLLAVSELASNAVRHARTPYTVVIEHDDTTISVSVRDHDPRLPSEHRATQESTGLGLDIIDSVSSAWGVTRIEDNGKVVWADLATRST